MIHFKPETQWKDFEAQLSRWDFDVQIDQTIAKDVAIPPLDFARYLCSISKRQCYACTWLEPPLNAYALIKTFHFHPSIVPLKQDR